MTISVRDLLARVHLFRPDLSESHSLWALQETARDIAKYSGICIQLQVPVVLSALTSKVLITPVDTSQTLIRVRGIRLSPVPYNSALSGVQYLGTWDASTNTPAIASGTASSANLYQFYIVTVAGSTTVDSETSFNVGDVLYSTGTEWKKITLEEFGTIDQISLRGVKDGQASSGFPKNWAQDTSGYIYLYPPPSSDLAMELELSVVPSRNQLVDDTAPWTFPMEAEDALVYGAMEASLRLPGSMQNIPEADRWRMRYLAEKANLKGLLMLGSGELYYKVKDITGRC